MNSYSNRTNIPEKGIDVSTTDSGGSVETVIQQAGSTMPAEDDAPPAVINVISTPIGTVEPEAQHHQVVADVRAGKYGNFDDIEPVANEETEGTL
jgi:hypothetical protein